MDVTQHYKLKQLKLYKNKLTEINLRNNINLIYLSLGENQLKHIDLSKNT